MLDGIDDILSNLPERNFSAALNVCQKNILATSTKGWTKHSEARCDLQPHRAFQHRCVWFYSVWKKSVTGRLLADIKADDREIDHFGVEVSNYIAAVLGTDDLSCGDWGLITAPRRRHKDRNFADLICKVISNRLNVPYYQDVLTARTSQRINADFSLKYDPPKHNLIVFDDFVTSGSTFSAIAQKLKPLNHVLLFVCGVNNH